MDLMVLAAQRWVNETYKGKKGYEVVEETGKTGWPTMRSLIRALQIEEGIAGANGHFGPGTSSHCPVLKQGDNSRFVTILKYALYCNNQDAQSFTTSFDAATKSAVYEFQKFSGLNATGVADLQTWKSLLISTGDPSRKGKACDCATRLTPAKAKSIKAAGYDIIGRYLANVPGGLDKKITSSELSTIFAAGLRVFPIFQLAANKRDYFTSARGTNDARQAIQAALEFGFPKNTIIYFAVDFDAMDYDVDVAILPYFKAVKAEFDKSNAKNYKVGIYAPRNVCSRVSNAGCACSSFVCDMSTGFSGNLGYPLPKNWAFDQISTIKVGSGDGAIEIDNNIYSGRDNGEYEVEKPEKPESKDAIVLIIKELYNEVFAFLKSPKTKDANIALLNFLRQFKYQGLEWGATLGPTDPHGFNKHIKDNKPELFKKIYDYIKGVKGEETKKAYINNEPIDLPHLAATTQGYIDSPIIPDFWTGWGGDLATAMADVTNLKSNDMKDKGLDEIAEIVIGNPTKYSFGIDDMMGDIDAISLSSNIGSKDLASLLNDYYLDVNSSIRRSLIIKDLKASNPSNVDELYKKTYDMMTGSSGFKHILVPSGPVALPEGLALLYKAKFPKDDVIKSTCKAFAKYILNKL
ncbi:glycoside hydrolase domain-containing protein [Paraclostridium bifermentans]|uniref:glycoside hydrolase domain-containing protein n=1 Tax=Paraclostridium bifermentans TaxID=1490 RepID=UPI001FF124A0|nr:glycoside hydrolase domain-containing protein [Paraclostridium bifermentans]UOW69530.1 DUF1906 domain-containing protein [Paraclostridium bifermentans]